MPRIKNPGRSCWHPMMLYPTHRFDQIIPGTGGSKNIPFSLPQVVVDGPVRKVIEVTLVSPDNRLTAVRDASWARLTFFAITSAQEVKPFYEFWKNSGITFMQIEKADS